MSSMLLMTIKISIIYPQLVKQIVQPSKISVFFSLILSKKTKQTIKRIINRKDLIVETNIKTIPESIDNSALNFIDSYTTLKEYFEEDAFDLIQDVLRSFFVI